jgi:hypothetical protein
MPDTTSIKGRRLTSAACIEAHYSRGDLRGRIAEALRAAGKDPDRLSIDDLAPLDEFHLLGRAATNPERDRTPGGGDPTGVWTEVFPGPSVPTGSWDRREGRGRAREDRVPVTLRL